MASIDEFGSRYESGVFTNNGYELLLSFLNSPNDDKDKLIPIVYFGKDHLEFMEDIANHLAILINDFGLPRIDDFFHSIEGWHHVKEVTVYPIKDHKKIWVTLYSEG